VTGIYTADRMEGIILEFLPRRTLEKRHLKGVWEDESLTLDIIHSIKL
jgi:hypothetical protein